MSGNNGTGRKKALVLGSGGALGVVQAAYIAAVAETGFQPDVVVGTSVGALNGAWVAMYPSDPDGLLRIWRGLDRRKVVELNLLSLAGRLLRHPLGISANRIVLELIETHVRDSGFSDTRLPFAVTATNLSRGCKEVFRRGRLRDAILASTAVPGLFHPVELNGELYVDGSLVAGTDLITAVEMGATEILAIDLTPTASPARPRTAVGVLRRSLEIVEQAATTAMEECLRLQLPVQVVRPVLQKQSSWNLSTDRQTIADHMRAARTVLREVIAPDGSLIPGASWALDTAVASGGATTRLSGRAEVSLEATGGGA